ncbi:MAG: mechanosensitive ion channel family protein [Myxococcota bacterium]
MPTSLPDFLQDRQLLSDIVATIVLFVAAFGLRHVALRFIRRRLPKDDQLQLRWNAQIRAFFFAVLGFGLFVIWAQELQALAVSFVVLAMAFVWATKETIACVQGAVYRVTSNAFTVGDRINIEGIRGDVIDQGVLSTLVLEVGEGHQRTGRTISIPNSLFLGAPVLNESLAGQYMLHVMKIPLDRDADLAAIEAKALSAARDVCAEFLEDVRRSIALRYRRHGLNPPLVDPRTTYQIVDKETVHLLLRIPTPVRLERDVEQRVLRAVLGVPIGRDTLVPPSPR